MVTVRHRCCCCCSCCCFWGMYLLCIPKERDDPERPGNDSQTTPEWSIALKSVFWGGCPFGNCLFPDARAARVSSAAPKKKSFDRGGPVWPPRSNVTNDRLGEGSGGALPPQPKFGGSGGQRPPAKTEFFSKIFGFGWGRCPPHSPVSFLGVPRPSPWVV